MTSYVGESSSTRCVATLANATTQVVSLLYAFRRLMTSALRSSGRP